jgi:hypothetical protein
LEKLQALEKRLDEFSPVVSDFQKEKETIRRTQEDQELDGEIEAYKSKYPGFDWKTETDSGHSQLESQILEYAIQNGIKRFTTAANDFLHDEFMKKAEFQAKEKVGKTIQANNKLGIGEKRLAPKSKPIRTDVRGKSYDDLAREAMDEFGIS